MALDVSYLQVLTFQICDMQQTRQLENLQKPEGIFIEVDNGELD